MGSFYESNIYVLKSQTWWWIEPYSMIEEVLIKIRNDLTDIIIDWAEFKLLQPGHYVIII